MGRPARVVGLILISSLVEFRFFALALGSGLLHSHVSWRLRDLLLDKRDDLLAEVLAIDLSFDLHDEGFSLLDGYLLSIGELGGNLRHQLKGVDSVELSRVVNLLVLELRAYLIKSALELVLLRARERQQAARVDTHSLDRESLSWEVGALNQKHLTNVVGHTSEELNGDLEFLASQDLTLHGRALNEARSRNGAQINRELKGHLANILNEEVAG